MLDTLMKPSEIVAVYLEENNFTINDLITIGGISRATAYNFLAGKQDMTFKIAAAVNKLIPEISIEFLLNYQVKYTCYIKKFENNNNIDNAKDLISFFCLDKLYPDLKNNDVKLCQKGIEIFGSEAFHAKRFELEGLPRLGLSIAKNNQYNATFSWIINSLYKAKKENKNRREKVVNYNNLNHILMNIGQYCGTTTIEETVSVFELVANLVGFNFYFCKSIPNSRVKGICIKLEDKNVFILLSDLFCNIENLWLTFIHELMHIKDNSFYDYERESEAKKDLLELKVDEDVIKLLTREWEINPADNLLTNAYSLSETSNIPVGVSAELVRSMTKIYNDRNLNSLIHTFKRGYIT